MAYPRPHGSIDDGTRGSAADETILERTDETLRRLLESSPVGTVAVDEEGSIAFANAAASGVLGRRPEDLVGESLAAFVVPEHRSMVDSIDEVDGPLELLASCEEGDDVPIAIDVRGLSEDGPQLFAGYVREATGHGDSSRAIDRYEAIAEMAGNGVYQLDPDHRFEMVSDTLVEMTGYSRGELLGEHASKLLDEAALEKREAAIREHLGREEDGRVTTVEFRINTADGETVPIEERVALLHSGDEVHGTVAAVRDISERKERVEELRQERELIEHILETSPVGIGVITPDGDISRVNDRAEDLLGLTMEEITNQTLDVSQRKLYGAEGEQVEPEDLLSRVFDDGEQVLNSEFTLERPDGDRVWAAISIAPMTGGVGEVEKAVIIATDISERKEREETLREERDVIEHVLETSPVGIGVITPDGDISRVNDRAEELFGLTDYELSNRTLDVSQRKLYDPEGQQVSPEDLLSRVFDEGERVLDTEFELGQPDGDRIWLSISIAPIPGPEGDVQKAVIIGKDATDRKEREETLREERELIEHVLETSPVGIGVITPDGDISRVNDRAEDLLGLTMEEITNQTLDVSQRKLYDSEGKQVAPEDLLSRVFDDEEQVLNSEFTLEQPDGDRVWAAISIAPMTGGVGEVEKAVIIATDVSDRKEREETLREERELIEHILETSPVGIGVITPDGDISRVNDRAEELLGLTMEEITNQTLDVSQRKLYGAEGEQVEPEDLLSRVFDDEEQVLNSEFTLERPTGDRVWAAISIAPMTGGAGEVEKAVIIATDVSDRKEREETLRRERELIEHILETSPVGIGVITPDGDISRVNDRAEELLGLTMEEITNQTLDVSQRKLYGAEGEQVAPEDLLSRVFDDGEQVLNSEFTLERPTGDRVWAAISIAPMTGGVGEVEKAVIIATDVSDRKEREETLREERDVIEHILETSPVGIGVITPDGDISRVNDRAEDLLGLTMEEITNQTLDVSQRKLYGASGERVPPEDLLSRVFDDGEQVLNSEFTLERPTGDRVWAAISIAPIESRDGDVQKAVVIATDISDRKERERRLRESEARLRQIAENINSAIWMADADMSEVLYINPAYEDITGRSRDSVYGNLMNHVDAVHPQDQRRVENAVKQVTRTPRGKDGALRFQEKYRIVRPDGSTRWVNSFAFPLRDENGKVYRFVGVIDDITEVKEQQLELGRHRDELETLNQINTVIRRVNQGLVQATNREEIERTVCKTLTDSKLYYAAWTGEADGGVRGVEPKAGTGIDAGALETTFAIDEVDPIATAVESGDIQIIRHFDDLPAGLAVGSPGGAGVRDSGQPFAAVIPLVYKETVYDVLVAYSSRANAFSAREQAVLLELGKTIGLAINAVERKKALLTDSVVELKFDIQDRDLFFVRASAETGAEFEMEGITSQSDGSYLKYFSVTGASPEEIVELAGGDTSVERVRVVNEHEDAFLLELVVSGASLASTLAEYGASIHTATYVDGNGTVLADLPQTAEVRTAVEAVTSRFADSEFVTKRERERSVQTGREFQAALEEALTERQRTTLEVAYYAGFFEWPRDSSGEEVAGSLDVAPATFHQHLRSGERKLVKTLVDEAKVA